MKCAVCGYAPEFAVDANLEPIPVILNAEFFSLHLQACRLEHEVRTTHQLVALVEVIAHSAFLNPRRPGETHEQRAERVGAEVRA